MENINEQLNNLLYEFFMAGFNHGQEYNEIGVGLVGSPASSSHCYYPDFDKFAEINKSKLDDFQNLISKTKC